MNCLLKNTAIVILLASSYTAYAQKEEAQKREIIEQRTDFLLSINEGGELDFTTLFEQLEVFYEQPLNLNAASTSDLEDLLLLSGIQINNLLQHIEQNGRLISLEELQSIEGFDLEIILLIEPFVKINSDLDRPSLSMKSIFSEGSSDLFIRYSRILEEQKGFSSIAQADLEDNPNARYLGSADKLYTRYRFKYANNISIGVTAEKDAGEEFFKGSQPNGFDFYSAHFFAQGFGLIKQVAIGDFQAQFGQGLTFWSGLAFGRSPSIFTLKRNATKLRPYTSVQEDLFLRGGGLTLEHKDVNLTIFYSSQKVDASLSGRDSLDNTLIFSSLSEDGFHRTPSELESKNVILNTNIGGNLSYIKRNFSFGLTAVHNEIGGSYQPRLALYNKFSRLDNQNTNVGADFNYLYKNFNVFGEFSHSIDGGYAYTAGALIVLDPRLSLGIQQRNYQKEYQPIQSNALGQSSTNSNEKGTFIGIESRINSDFTLSTYADQFVFPWLSYQTNSPSDGYLLFSQITYRPSKKLETYFRYRSRKKGENDVNITEGIDAVVDELQSNYRLHLDYQLSKSIKINSRVELTKYQLGENKSESGILIYQDISYKKLSSPISFSLRYALFDTDSYNSRIYAYESDVLYAFSIPSYSGRGSRFYITCKYHLVRGIDIWLRYAQSYYTDREIIGSGKDQINGATKSEIKAQLRVHF